MKFCTCIVFLFLNSFISAQDNQLDDPYDGVLELKKSLDVPKPFYSVHFFNPVSYLEMFEEKDLINFRNDSGKAREPEKLKKLVLEANKATLEKYKQTYLIDRSCSLIKMLEATFPELKEIKGEPRILLSDLAKVLAGPLIL